MSGGYTLRRVPTLSIVKSKKLGVWAKNSDHAGEQKRHSRWGIGFLQSDQFYSAFVSATLASRCQHERGSDILNVCVDIVFRPMPRTHEQARRVRSMELEICLASA